jgi:hypothetical protein
MLRRRLAYGLTFALGIATASCGSPDGDDKSNTGGAGGSQASGGQAGAPDDGGWAGGPSDDAAAPDAADDAAPEAVQFTDAQLEQCVRTALQLPDGDLTPDALAQLTHLECQDMGISSIAGLQHATALVELSLWENAIADIEPLTNLTQLQDLQLGNNEISDVSALSNLTSLRRLGLANNQVASLQPLGGLTSLAWLNLDRNAFGEAELTHLAGLTSLRWLTIEHNGIQNHAALQPVIDAGCDLYDHHRAIDADHAILPGRSLLPVFADPARLRMRFDPSGRVTMSYDLDGRPLAVRQVRGSLVRRGNRIVTAFGSDAIEVGRLEHGKPVLCRDQHANVCRLRVGMKWPEAGPKLPGTGTDPVVTVSLELLDSPRMHVRDGNVWGAADDDLLPFVLASPNQFDAGSCLFMANTGAMEILLNQHTPPEDIKYDGDTDLSERYLMSAYDHAPASNLPYFLTDLLYTYEAVGGSLLNRDYNFCAGYVVESADGSVSPAKSTDENARLSCSYNWFDMMPDDWKSMLVPTPPADRTIIAVDPKRDDNSRWRVALFDDDTVERIKYELRTKNAPVIVIYNHYLYWHANVVVGYDDTVASDGCPMVTNSIEYFEENGAASYANAIRAHMDTQGGCSQSGVFYVRDSIYEGDSDEPDYDYSTAEVTIQKEKYAERLIKLDYNWVKYLGNHTYTVHRK